MRSAVSEASSRASGVSPRPVTTNSAFPSHSRPQSRHRQIARSAHAGSIAAAVLFTCANLICSAHFYGAVAGPSS